MTHERVVAFMAEFPHIFKVAIKTEANGYQHIQIGYPRFGTTGITVDIPVLEIVVSKVDPSRFAQVIMDDLYRRVTQATEGEA